MCKLTYEELILLDNLIYLEWDAKEDYSLMDIVYDLLNDQDFDKLMNNMGNCIIKMPKSEWIYILDQIINKPNLKNLKIKNVENYKNGMKFACFVDNESNAIVVFRGTTTIKEWEDNGEGAYEYDTEQQIEALNFINSLKYNNITVTGHSKGGNKAQYVAILSPKISNCVSINGQGFSNEFLSKYKYEINKNKSKIISINAEYDYVNCLFNSIAGECHYIKTEFQIKPFYYHKANILLNKNGDLRKEVDEAVFSKIINEFSNTLISDLPKDIQNVIINIIIYSIELILCKGESRDNILKISGKFLIMLCYENCFKYKENFNKIYALLEVLILPLLFWEDFIKIEEVNSKELLDKVIGEINLLGDGVIKKLEIIDKDSVKLIESISKAINNLTLRLENKALGI
jgi:hypothetical protein